MSGDAIDFSIVSVNHNTCALLVSCLTSIYRSRGEATFEIVVVDNNSSDESVAMVQSQFQNVRVIMNSENQGFARASNQGIRIARGRYILLLNSDTEVFPDTFDQLKHFLENVRFDSKIGIIGCKIVNSDNTHQYSVGKFPTIWSTITGMFRSRPKRKYYLFGYDEPHEVDWVTGAFMLIDRRVIYDAGLLDERYFMYYEDVDYCLKAKKRGWKVFYYPKVRIIHKHPYGSKQNHDGERVMIEIRGSHLYYYRKNHSYVSFIILSFATIIFLLIKLFCLNTTLFLGKENRRDRERRVRLLLSSVWNTFRELNKKASTLLESQLSE